MCENKEARREGGREGGRGSTWPVGAIEQRGKLVFLLYGHV